MKMKKMFFYLLLCSPLVCLSQKVEFNKKTKEVTVDGVHSFNIDATGCGLAFDDCHYEIFDTTGAKVIRINYREFKSFVERNQANPQGIVRYYEFIFFTSKTKAEIEYTDLSKVALAKLILKNNLVSAGKINDKAVGEFVFANGTPFSQRAATGR